MRKYIYIYAGNCLLTRLPYLETILHYHIRVSGLISEPDQFFQQIKQEYPSATTILIPRILKYKGGEYVSRLHRLE